MSRRHVIYSLMLFDAVDASTAQDSRNTNPAQPVLEFDQLDKVRIHIVQSDPASTGTYHLWARQGEKGTFGEVDFGTPLIADASDGELQISLTELPGSDMYLTYTPTAGNGTITAVLSASNVGA